MSCNRKVLPYSRIRYARSRKIARASALKRAAVVDQQQKQQEEQEQKQHQQQEQFWQRQLERSTVDKSTNRFPTNFTVDDLSFYRKRRFSEKRRTLVDDHLRPTSCSFERAKFASLKSEYVRRYKQQPRKIEGNQRNTYKKSTSKDRWRRSSHPFEDEAYSSCEEGIAEQRFQSEYKRKFRGNFDVDKSAPIERKSQLEFADYYNKNVVSETRDKFGIRPATSTGVCNGNVCGDASLSAEVVDANANREQNKRTTFKSILVGDSSTVEIESTPLTEYKASYELPLLSLRRLNIKDDEKPRVEMLENTKTVFSSEVGNSSSDRYRSEYRESFRRYDKELTRKIFKVPKSYHLYPWFRISTDTSESAIDGNDRNERKNYPNDCEDNKRDSTGVLSEEDEVDKHRRASTTTITTTTTTTSTVTSSANSIAVTTKTSLADNKVDNELTMASSEKPGRGALISAKREKIENTELRCALTKYPRDIPIKVTTRPNRCKKLEIRGKESIRDRVEVNLDVRTSKKPSTCKSDDDDDTVHDNNNNNNFIISSKNAFNLIDMPRIEGADEVRRRKTKNSVGTQQRTTDDYQKPPSASPHSRPAYKLIVTNPEKGKFDRLTTKCGEKLNYSDQKPFVIVKNENSNKAVSQIDDNNNKWVENKRRRDLFTGKWAP